MNTQPRPDFLADARLYLTEFERLAGRLRRRGDPWSSLQWGASLGDLWLAREELAERLAETVAAGRYELGAVEARSVVVGDKTRTLHRFSWIDQIVVATLARGLSSLAEPRLPAAVHSYRPGRSPTTAIGALQSYLRDHQRKTPLRSRGLYVIRRDVKSYGEQIPNDDRSALWPVLSGVTAALPEELRPVAGGLLRAALRPEVIHPDGHRGRLERGTPTGSPLQPLVNNLYLEKVDRAMMGLDGGLYLRFGDDILFAHPDATRARAADARLTDRIAQHGLTFNTEKNAHVYWTGCGRPSGESPHSKGSSQIEFLGYRIAFEGRVALKPRRVRLLMDDLRRRWQNTLNLSTTSDPGLRRRRLCRVTSEALDPRRPLHHGAISQLHAVNDREHLRQLDFTIALAAAEYLTGRRGVRAFRNEPYRRLRAAGLPSLLVARNRGSMRAATASLRTEGASAERTARDA